jgi:hypothetical protein
MGVEKTEGGFEVEWGAVNCPVFPYSSCLSSHVSCHCIKTLELEAEKDEEGTAARLYP